MEIAIDGGVGKASSTSQSQHHRSADRRGSVTRGTPFEWVVVFTFPFFLLRAPCFFFFFEMPDGQFDKLCSQTSCYALFSLSPNTHTHIRFRDVRRESRATDQRWSSGGISIMSHDKIYALTHTRVLIRSPATVYRNMTRIYFILLFFFFFS